jgi:hypothetical protein
VRALRMPRLNTGCPVLKRSRTVSRGADSSGVFGVTVGVREVGQLVSMLPGTLREDNSM